MKITIIYEGKERKISVAENAKIKDVIVSAGLPPQAIIVLRNGVPVPHDDNVAGGDVLTLIYVASGG